MPTSYPNSPTLRPKPRRGWSLIVLLAGISTVGCSAWRVEDVPVAEVIDRDRPEVLRVTRIDDSFLPVYDPVIVRNSLRGLPTARAVNGISISLGDIRSVATKHFSFGKTALLVLASAGGLVVFDLLQSVNEPTAGF